MKKEKKAFISHETGKFSRKMAQINGVQIRSGRTPQRRNAKSIITCMFTM